MGLFTKVIVFAYPTNKLKFGDVNGFKLKTNKNDMQKNLNSLIRKFAQKIATVKIEPGYNEIMTQNRFYILIVSLWRFDSPREPEIVKIEIFDRKKLFPILIKKTFLNEFNKIMKTKQNNHNSFYEIVSFEEDCIVIQKEKKRKRTKRKERKKLLEKRII